MHDWLTYFLLLRMYWYAISATNYGQKKYVLLENVNYCHFPRSINVVLWQ